MTEETYSSGSITRRRLLLGGGAVLILGVLAKGRSVWAGEEESPLALSVEEAHERAASGDLLLVDIRQPNEWARTGSGAGARRLDMRRTDFTEELMELAGGRDRPVALICASGVRSQYMAGRLSEAGFGRVYDVPEGMLGSGAGPGWLRKGLPVVDAVNVQR